MLLCVRKEDVLDPDWAGIHDLAHQQLQAQVQLGSAARAQRIGACTQSLQCLQ